MLDFSNADEQREFVRGPVPSGSIVMVEMEVLQPYVDRRAPENPYYSVSPNGLRQAYCQFTVKHGTYSGVSWRQNITLPLSEQKVQLTQGQTRACHIGASQFKAICLASSKPPKCQDITSLTSLCFPVKVKINDRPVEKDGEIYWNNEIALIITPDKENYQLVRNGGEVITDGPVTGSKAASQGQNGYTQGQARQQGGDPYDRAFPSESHNTDEVPF